MGLARRPPGWASVASVSLIEFAATSDHVNPFSVTHEDPERIIISNVAGEGAHHLLVNWTSIFDASRCGCALKPSAAACATATSGPSSSAPTAGPR